MILMKILMMRKVTDDVRKSDFDEVDVEDEYPDKFFVSSFNEDALMDDFVIWL